MSIRAWPPVNMVSVLGLVMTWVLMLDIELLELELEFGFGFGSVDLELVFLGVEFGLMFEGALLLEFELVFELFVLELPLPLLLLAGVIVSLDLF